MTPNNNDQSQLRIAKRTKTAFKPKLISSALHSESFSRFAFLAASFQLKKILRFYWLPQLQKTNSYASSKKKRKNGKS